MTSTIEGIKALLITKISAIQYAGSVAFADVIGYSEGDMQGFPAARVVITEGEGALADTHRNERTFRFELRMFQEQSEQGRTKNEAEAILTGILDQTLLAFDQDKNLGNQVMRVRVISFKTDFAARPSPWNFATVTIEVVAFVTSY